MESISVSATYPVTPPRAVVLDIPEPQGDAPSHPAPLCRAAVLASVLQKSRCHPLRGLPPDLCGCLQGADPLLRTPPLHCCSK